MPSAAGPVRVLVPKVPDLPNYVCVRADIVQAVGLQATEDFIAGFCFILERLLVFHEI